MRVVLAGVAAVTAVLSFKIGMATGRGADGATPVRPAESRRAPSPAAVLAASTGAGTTASREARARAERRERSRKARGAPSSAEIATLNEVIDEYCIDCHSDGMLLGNLSIEGYDIAHADTARAKSEKMIRKLRTEMMPLPGRPRPGGDTLRILADAIERVIDRASPINPGTKTFQRLNRAEYEHAVRDLLGVTVNAGDYLPLDTKSANFDNVAAVQALSPILLESYLNAASAVSRMAVGDRKAHPELTTYRVSQFISQHPWDHVEGTPYGTRGGIVAEHTFLADGEYEFRFNIAGGIGTSLEDLDVSVDGQRVALVRYEQGVNRSFTSQDLPYGVDLFRTAAIPVTAGRHKVAVAFVKRAEGPYEDLIRPHQWSLASNGGASVGTTMPPHVFDLSVVGPNKITGMSETPSRRQVFSCRPTAASAERACADQIITRLGTRAYRRPLTKKDRDGLLAFYDKGAQAGGFEEGVRTSLQAMLSSPFFVFRFESTPENATPGKDYRISDYELASRLSFFLWNSIPDDRLLRLAGTNQLSAPLTLQAEVKRMLADPRAEALATRFAGQWLHLQDIDKVRPDVFWFPDYDDHLGAAMRRETELFVGDIIRNDRSIMTLFTANYTFLNERLARHYGIPNISGDQFRKVTYPDDTRRGILGQGSVLLQTSVANRTSPVLRGKWVMDVLIGMPPPPPPENVPSLDETADGHEGKPLTTRERMEQHRKNITCRTCHQYMDPIGLALDNFDVTGKWRYREAGVPLDTKGNMWDGTPVSTPAELTKALTKRPIPLVRAFTENLMVYALGRRMDDADQTTVRAIAQASAASNYRFSSFVTGVVNSAAFRMRRAEPVMADDETR